MRSIRTENNGGDTTVHFYYDSQWRIVETRNGSKQSTRQGVMGTQYTDEIVFIDVNGDPTTGNDANHDSNILDTSGCRLAGTAAAPRGQGPYDESRTDHRYFYQQY